MSEQARQGGAPTRRSRELRGGSRGGYGDFGHLTVVGLGRIGATLARGFAEQGLAVSGVRRGGEGLLADPGPGPIVVATRVADLPGVVEAVQPERRGDLVLLQNGDLIERAAALDLPGATLGVLWVAVARLGDAPLPGRPSALSGPHAEAVASHMTAAGIPARAVDGAELRRELALKLLWLSVVPVVAASRRQTVGDAAASAEAEIRALLGELAPVAAARYGVPLDEGEAAEIVLGYTQSIPAFPGGVKEIPDRNGLFLDWGRRQGRAQPLHRALLSRVGVEVAEGA